VKVKKVLLDMVRKELPEEIVDKHFTPSYNPWEQRLCLIPNSDFFEAIKDKSASVVTDHIECIEPTGIKLKSGDSLPADIIISATGLILESFGGVKMSIDNKPIEASETLTYKSLMFSNIPNLVNCFGYINASWTLKADLTSEYVCRLLKYMDKNDYEVVCPVEPLNIEESRNFLTDFSSGYLERAAEIQPRQGNEKPWVNLQDYIKDWFDIKFRKLNDGNLHFSKNQK
jgi:cation diffusion facilitator CzcD-associated flavoprotein CzcO